MTEYHCEQCDKLLFKAALGPGTRLEIVCLRCRKKNDISTPVDAVGDVGMISDGMGGLTPAELRA